MSVYIPMENELRAAWIHQRISTGTAIEMRLLAEGFNAWLANRDAQVLEALVTRMQGEVEPQARAGSWKSFNGVVDLLMAEADSIRLSQDSEMPS